MGCQCFVGVFSLEASLRLSGVWFEVLRFGGGAFASVQLLLVKWNFP